MLIETLKEKIKKIYFYRHSLWSMSLKQFKAKYAGSILGVSWAIINPLLIMLAITFVFTAVFKATIPDFGLFVLAGIMPWMFFSGALSEATSSFLSQKSVLHQFSLPKEILPLACVFSYFLNFLMGWCVVYPIFLFHNPKILLMLPLFVFLLTLSLVFACGLGLLFGLVNVFFRDLEHLTGIIMMLWFWVTPIFYTIGMVPKGFRLLFSLNPMLPFILCYQDIIFLGKMPDFAIFLGIAGWAFLGLFIGLLASVVFEPSALKRI